MKHWISIVCLFAAVGAMSLVRWRYRDRLVQWSATRAGTTSASGRSRAFAVHASAFIAAAMLVGLGLWSWVHGGTVGYWRYPLGLAILGLYVPFAAVASPKLTKWQKSHEQRLVAAGAARDAACGWDRIARVFSVLGVVPGFVAVFLLVAPS